MCLFCPALWQAQNLQQDSHETLPPTVQVVEQVSDFLNSVVYTCTNVSMGMTAGNLNATVESLAIIVSVNEEVSQNFIDVSTASL